MTRETYNKIKCQLIDSTFKKSFEKRIHEHSDYSYSIDEAFLDTIESNAEGIIFNKTRQIGFTTMLLTYALANPEKEFLYITNRTHPILNSKSKLYNNTYIKSLNKIDNTVGNITFITPTSNISIETIINFKGVIIIDEAAFIKESFLKEIFTHNYDAKHLTVSILMGNFMKATQVIIGSTPNKREGFFYELYSGLNTTNFEKGYNIKDLSLTFTSEFLELKKQELNDEHVFNQYYNHTFLPSKKGKDKMLCFRLDEDINVKLEKRIEELSFYRGKPVGLSDFLREIIIKELNESNKFSDKNTEKLEKIKKLMKRYTTPIKPLEKIDTEKLFKTIFGEDVEIIRKK